REHLIENFGGTNPGTGGECGQQKSIANRVDCRRISAGTPMDFGHRLRWENRLLRSARLRQTEFDVILSLLGCKRLESATQNSVLLEPFQIQCIKRSAQFGAASEDGLEQFDLVIAQAGQVENLVEDVRGEVVRVVHDQCHGSTFPGLLE